MTKSKRSKPSNQDHQIRKTSNINLFIYKATPFHLIYKIHTNFISRLPHEHAFECIYYIIEHEIGMNETKSTAMWNSINQIRETNKKDRRLGLN